MFRMIAVSAVCIAVTVSVQAAENNADAVMVRLLVKEASSPVDRRPELTPVLKPSGTDPACWQAGQVMVDGGWKSYDQAVEFFRANSTLKSYYQRRSDMDSDSAQAHFDLAEWCRQQELPLRERAHLHVAMTKDSRFITRHTLERCGFILSGGRWLSPDEQREMKHHQARINSSLEAYGRDASTLHRLLVRSRGRSSSAREKVMAFDDPTAVIAVALTFLQGPVELHPIAVEFLSRLECVESTQLLAGIALSVNDATLRRLATEALNGRRLEDFVPALVNLTATEVDEMEMSMTWFVTPEELGAWNGGRSASQWLTLPRLPAERRTRQFMQKRADGTQGVRSSEVLLPTTDRNPAALEESLDANARDYQLRSAVASEDERTEFVNRRVHAVLAAVTGQSPNDDPEFWWQWWNRHVDAAPAMPSMQIRDLGENVRLRQVDLGPATGHCFEEETHVLTDLGPRFIMQIEPGDLVLSKDVETGELIFKPVLAVTMRDIAPMVGIADGKRGLACTRGHNFWRSGRGWVKAGELSKGDLIHTSTGSIAIEQTAVSDPQKSLNLLVADTHTFFVGEQGLLVQDARPIRPTNMVVPGLNRYAFEKAGGVEPDNSIPEEDGGQTEVKLPKL